MSVGICPRGLIFSYYLKIEGDKYIEISKIFGSVCLAFKAWVAGQGSVVVAAMCEWVVCTVSARRRHNVAHVAPQVYFFLSSNGKVETTKRQGEKHNSFSPPQDVAPVVPNYPLPRGGMMRRGKSRQHAAAETPTRHRRWRPWPPASLLAM